MKAFSILNSPNLINMRAIFDRRGAIKIFVLARIQRRVKRRVKRSIDYVIFKEPGKEIATCNLTLLPPNTVCSHYLAKSKLFVTYISWPHLLSYWTTLEYPSLLRKIRIVLLQKSKNIFKVWLSGKNFMLDERFCLFK